MAEAARHTTIDAAVAHAAHLLPAQGPITAFVHHNTLHALEHLPFAEAVVRGAEIFGCHPYLSEAEYRRQMDTGRIRLVDLEAVLIDDLGDRADELLGFLGTRFHLRLSMLGKSLFTGPVSEVRWVMAETDALRRFRRETPAALRERAIQETRRWVSRDLRDGNTLSDAHQLARQHFQQITARLDDSAVEQWEEPMWEACCLHLLWLCCRAGVRSIARRTKPRPTPLRHRDGLLEVAGEDSDALVHGVLIRFCAAFLDQGLSSWPLDKEVGLFRAFLDVYGRPLGPPDRWMRGLSTELERIRQASISPRESIAESLEQLGVGPTEHGDFIAQSMLALRGFAGMIWQMESRADRVALPVSPDALVEFLAVRLILDRFAIRYVASEAIGYHGPLCELRESLAGKLTGHKQLSIDQRTFLIFQLAQLLGWSPPALYRLSPADWSMVVGEVEDFSRLERRRIFHAAYERRYRLQALDALAAHTRQRTRWRNMDAADTERSAEFQLVTCLDEREESFRRHLEELAPQCETFGVAGFFAVAMYYRGAADAHYVPLCPVIVTPRHYVAEQVVDTLRKTALRRSVRRRAIGTVTHRAHLGSRTFAGGWLAAVLGSIASIPLVFRILFPRTKAHLRRLVGSWVRPPAETQLKLERADAAPGPGPGHVGYTVAEMAEIVERLLRDIGLTHQFARLVVICGHGSSSMNNPHEAAHDCGACGGGRGGPNARAFAHMANDPRVRRVAAAHGLSIPTKTVFLGAYHNTCDDAVTYYDLDRLPASHQADFELARARVDRARGFNAQERCRRFHSAEPRLTPDSALRHVEARAEDLSQVRPEYGHATNALCFVGRREWSRGLFLDRRAFLQSYDPTQDDERRTILKRVLQAVVPVCAGINLEYYFSRVDPIGYGCGTKLPHNITSLLGVMDGAASDLRPGLPWQMVEIHEPVRLLLVIETTPEVMLSIMDENEGIGHLVRGGWIQLATFDAEHNELHFFHEGRFTAYQPESDALPEAASSSDWYRGWRDQLGFASILPTYQVARLP